MSGNTRFSNWPGKRSEPRELRQAFSDWPLYRRVLQQKWETLPAAIRDLHNLHSRKVMKGFALVERGTGYMGLIVAALFNFPKAGKDVPVEVRFERWDGQEIWQRVFAGKSFSSVQFEGTGRYKNLICERFGPFTFGLELVVDEQTLRLETRNWDILGLPLPVAMAPRGYAYETEEAGRFHLHVEIGLPIVGVVVRYHGWLAEPSASS